MKIYTYSIITCLFLISILSAAVDHSNRPENFKYHFECWENFNIDVKGSDVVIKHYGPDDCVVEISKDGELFIDGEKVKTDRQSRRLLQDYNQQMRSLISSAEAIGCEAAKIGGKGAQLGLEAVSGILEVMCTDLEMEQLEEKLDKKAEKIERQAKKLEDKAEELEAQAEELEGVHEQLKSRISELEGLDWF
jgi:cell division protein ZapA (FtsZ GTPase activity inhibitor)